MASATALGFLLLGLSLLALDAEDGLGMWLFQALAAGVVMLGFVAILGYLYGLRALYEVPGIPRWHCTRPSCSFCWAPAHCTLVRSEVGWRRSRAVTAALSWRVVFSRLASA
jgi:hypothetical protein